MKKRVVITGLGAVTPCGVGAELLWQAVVAGQCSARMISRFDASDLHVNFAGEVADFEFSDFVNRAAGRHLDRSSRFALVGASLAHRDAALDSPSRGGSFRMGVIDGSSLGALATILDEHRDYVNGSVCKGGPHVLVAGMTGTSSSAIASYLGCHGMAETLSVGSVSASIAIGHALRSIQYDHLDIVIAGGTEAPLHHEIMLPFAKGGLLSKEADNPGSACRPFGLGRDGFVMSEGAVYLVLEELDHALARDARIYCEIVGFAENCDAYSQVAPDPSGAGLAHVLRSCCAESPASLADVGYVNLHGTATRANDLSESAAIAKVFGIPERQPWCGSTKPVTGHLLGASGAVEAAIVALSLHKQAIPPSLNCDPRDPECNVKCPTISQSARYLKLALSCNSSFGGRNTVLAFKTYVNN